jgi:diacylglycerol O-acyltransferase
VVTNVPGPQFPLYLLGRRLSVLFPVVPLAQRQALGIAVMSYDGHLGFGLLGDYDALPELDAIALDLKWAIGALSRAAGVGTRGARISAKPAKPRASTTARKPAKARSAAAARKPASAS